MKKLIASNPKISHAFLAMIFSILFIFTAFYNPIEAHAAGDVEVSYSDISMDYVINLGSYGSNEFDESSEQEAGYLYYAASEDRCGVMFYVVDAIGQIQAHGILLDKAGTELYRNYAGDVNYTSLAYKGDCWARRDLNSITDLSNVKYVDNISTVYYSGGWQAKGSDAMDYLTSIANVGGTDVKIKIDGVEMPCPWWAYYVYTSNPDDNTAAKAALRELANPRTKWRVFVEPVSVNYLYTENHFDRQVDNTIGSHNNFAAGSPIPEGKWVGDSYEPKVHLGTATRLMVRSNDLKNGGTRYTYKFYNTQFPFSMCLENDVTIKTYAGGMSVGGRTFKGIRPGELRRLSRDNWFGSEGIGLAAIDITGFSLPPIHTFDGTNTPGDTEVPKEENGTAGECVIRKLYYTETLNADGTVNTEADPEYHWFKRTGTTAYVSIDNEDGYEIERWRITSTDTEFTRKEHWNNTGSGWGDISAQVVRMADSIATDGANKYLYILYKKTVVQAEPAEYEFLLEESQITKRVSFIDSELTKSLFENIFSWTSRAHTTTACQAHGGYGHRLNCNTEWDVAPRDTVPHVHSAHSDEKKVIICDNNHCGGEGNCIRSHTHGHVYSEVTCKAYCKRTCGRSLCSSPCTVTTATHVCHTAHTDSCYTTVCTKTISKSRFNLITVIFQGNDKHETPQGVYFFCIKI